MLASLVADPRLSFCFGFENFVSQARDLRRRTLAAALPAGTGMSHPIELAVNGAARRTQHYRLRLWRPLAVLVLALVGLGVTTWWGRAPLLRGVADAWIISDPPAVADAAAVFGGGLETRPFAAAEYYREGLVKEVLVSSDRVGPAARLGVVPSDEAAAREVLLKLGVQADAIHSFGAHLANTDKEALALRDWAIRHHVHTLIVPTEIFATRRLRWTLHHVFGDSVVIRVPALDPPDYDATNWWKNERGVIDFQNEVIKYLYYRLKY
jgi:uncharacterized SAM-binding protein YcdF (DUF218 family)